MSLRDTSTHAVADAPDPSTGTPAMATVPDLPWVHPVYLRLLIAGAAAEGIALTDRLLPPGLDAAALDAHDGPVPLATWRQAMLGLQRQSRRPGLAVRLGRQVPLLAHGPLAYLMASSRDLRQALEALVRFAPLRLAVLELRLRETGQGVELHARPRVSLGDVEAFTLDFLWAMLATMLVELRPGSGRTMTLRLPEARAEAAAAWAEQGVALERSTAGSLLVLPRSLAEAPLPTASPSEHLRAWQACEQAEREQGWSKSTAALIEQLFRTGAAAGYSLDWVAARLGMSRRTVIRRLGDEGTTFSALVEASRKERLRRRLAERQLTLGEIAVDLGYADGSAFSRAVQRWFGMAPRALQRLLGEGRALPAAG